LMSVSLATWLNCIKQISEIYYYPRIDLKLNWISRRIQLKTTWSTSLRSLQLRSQPWRTQ
jgi:hypothetical protein